MQPRDTEWEAIVRLVRSYALRKYGDPAVGVTIHLAHGDAHREPVGLVQVEAQQQAAPALQRPTWGSGPEPKKTDDYRCIYWPGQGVFYPSAAQAKVIEKLWLAWRDSLPGVRESALMAAASVNCRRLHDIFRSRGSEPNMLGTLIVRGGAAGLYRLAPLPGEDGGESAEATQDEQ